MKQGYWDRDGFHEGVMPVVDFAVTGEQERAYQAAKRAGQRLAAMDFGKETKVLSSVIDAHMDRNRAAQDAMAAEALFAGCAIQKTIVNPDGSVDIINPSRSPYWQNFTSRRTPIADRKPESADNLRQQVTGLARGACNSPAQASRHSSESEAAWVERELGDVPAASGPLKCADGGIDTSLTDPWRDLSLAAATVGDVEARSREPTYSDPEKVEIVDMLTRMHAAGHPVAEAAEALNRSYPHMTMRQAEAGAKYVFEVRTRAQIGAAALLSEVERRHLEGIGHAHR